MTSPIFLQETIALQAHFRSQRPLPYSPKSRTGAHLFLDHASYLVNGKIQFGQGDRDIPLNCSCTARIAPRTAPKPSIRSQRVGEGSVGAATTCGVGGRGRGPGRGLTFDDAVGVVLRVEAGIQKRGEILCSRDMVRQICLCREVVYPDEAAHSPSMLAALPLARPSGPAAAPLCRLSTVALMSHFEQLCSAGI